MEQGSEEGRDGCGLKGSLEGRGVWEEGCEEGRGMFGLRGL